MTTREPLWQPGKNAITLRDYFAAAAMQGCAVIEHRYSYDEIAAKAFTLADAMIAHRDGEMPWCERCGCYHSPKAEHVK
jgi:hypothetical protein